MQTTTTEADVLTTLDLIREGLRNRDAQAVVQAYVTGATIFDLAPPMTHVVDANELQQWIDGWQGPIQWKTKAFKCAVSDGLAVAHGFVHVSARTKGGEDAAWWARATFCFTRQRDGWKILHEHTSVPFYMDGSFRAAIDLSPE